MLLNTIAISDFPLFSKFDRDFNKPLHELNQFIKWNPTVSSSSEIIQQRSQYPTDRNLLHTVLKDQYQKLKLEVDDQQNLDLLLSKDTFTVVTAHQPALFSGPAFVITKALSTIKLAQEIQKQNPQHKIIPLFVIGSEDHDAEELNHCYLMGNKITWETDQKGPVGRYALTHFEHILHEAKQLLNASKFGSELIPILEKAYNPANTFADAFQILLHELLGNLGILILNTDDARFKRHLMPFIKQEVMHSTSKPLIQKIQTELKAKGYDQAAFARDINFFYFDYGFRDRIEKKDDIYTIIGQDKKFSSAEMELEIEQHPERFSPNVIMRPLCQEILLPNLAYVGGGGEIAYWIERKAQFETFSVPYPMLVRRDSFMIMAQEQYDQLRQFNLTLADLATRSDLLINQTAESISTSVIQLAEESTEIIHWMDRIRLKAEAVDKTLGANVEAEKTKVLKSIETIEKKMLKAEKLKLEVQLNKVKKLQDKLMPENGLLERKENFMTFYAEHGKTSIATLLNDCNPLDGLFKAIKL